MLNDLEKQLKEWRETRNRDREAAPQAVVRALAANERRTVRVNGQEVLVISRSKKPGE
jgi:hypothetical protein